MFKIIKYLILIRLRNFLPKGDSFANFLFFLFYVLSIYFLNKIYVKYGSYFIYASLLDIFLYHSNRKDLELIKRYKDFKLLIFVEYLIYALPFLFIYVINANFWFIVIQLLFTFLTVFIKPQSFKANKYPFLLFDPFWHICFRKYKLIIFFPIVIMLNYLGWEYDNENLNIASLFVAGLFACVPSFQREEIDHIKISYFKARQYIVKQIKNVLYNSSFLCVSILFCFLVFRKWDLLVFLPLLFFVPVVNILFKYSFYFNTFLHQLFFILFIVYVQSGLPLLVLPFLFYKSIKTIEKIQYATNSY